MYQMVDSAVGDSFVYLGIKKFVGLKVVSILRD